MPSEKKNTAIIKEQNSQKKYGKSKKKDTLLFELTNEKLYNKIVDERK